MNQRPNIIYIMSDDVGYGDIGCYNPESRIPTPNIDRLAREGVRFSDAHSPSAVCTPTRYSVLTGRYCWRSRLKYSVLFAYEPPLIEEERLTVARLLQEAGYHTACIGKWHLGLGYTAKPGAHIDFGRALPWSSRTERSLEEQLDFTQPLRGGPTALGFDYFYGTSGCPTCQPPYGWIEGEHFVKLPSHYHAEPVYTSRPGMMAPGWRHEDADPIIAARAVSYVEERARANARAESKQPFFLYLCPSAAHEPCTEGVTPDFSRGRSGAGPRGDLVWLFDWMVGQVMDALERTGQAENTLVMVTSDNGALPGDRVRGDNGDVYRTYDHKSCGDWRGYKAHIWEGGHREPFICRWPGAIQPNTVSDELVSLVDLAATCAALVGSDLPDDAAEDSYNILPALRGPALRGAVPPGQSPQSPIRPSLLHHSGTGVFAVRQGDWKLILDTLGSGGWPPPRGERPVPGSPGQLYHIGEDPAEEHNLWAERPQVVAEMAALVKEQHEAGRSRPPSRAVERLED
jgi:arylsulfatase A-like enzyme